MQILEKDIYLLSTVLFSTQLVNWFLIKSEHDVVISTVQQQFEGRGKANTEPLFNLVKHQLFNHSRVHSVKA
jgi:hypothetical protein